MMLTKLSHAVGGACAAASTPRTKALCNTVVAPLRSVGVSRSENKRVGDLQVRNMGFFDNLFGGGDGEEKKEGGWASIQRPGCELAPAEAPEGLELATFAGGCFWGLELAFQRVPGVVATSVGYTQGNDASPTYEKVCSGRTGHTEAIQVTFDPKETSFMELMRVFSGRTDLTTLNRQGNDMGTQYRSGVYYHNDDQKLVIETFYEELNAAYSEQKTLGIFDKKVVAECEAAGDYYLAEKYHQQYLSKGGRFNQPQSAEKGCTDKIRCYG